jgi:hypothetical protein
MERLGYRRYVAQGGDVGALVTDAMGRRAPAGLVGIHMNLLVAVLAVADQLPAQSEQERAALVAATTFSMAGNGIFLSRPPDRRRSATPCWTRPSPWQPGCSTTTPTATTRSPEPLSTTRPQAISLGTASSTASRCTG